VTTRHRSALSVLAHVAIVVGAYGTAFALRFDLAIPARFFPVALRALPIAVGAKIAAFATVGLFAGSWHHLGMRDVEEIVRGNLLGSALFVVAMVFLHELPGFPRAVFLVDLMLCVSATSAIRFLLRRERERVGRPAHRRIETLALIVGAGSAGIRLLEEIESRPRLGCAVVGFVDDDPARRGVRLAGTPVLGGVDDLPALVAAHDVTEVLIAIPSASGTALRRIVQRCTEAGVRHRVLPTLGELVEGRVMYTQMREVKVDDLLAREPVELDLPGIRSLVSGRTILVTGAAGSIGSELCRQVAAHGPGRLVLYDRHENGIYGLEMELRARFPDLVVEPVLGDVLLEDQLRAVFAQHRPALVLHAAAYKHVPIAEMNVIETVRNNVLGSTDKAVRPSSVMGVTKRIAEMIVQGMQGRGCRFVAVRFGNVLGSSGSVVPLFREQIARGGPVTVTHPEVTRYFMTIPEASRLILQALAIGRGGEIFVLEMGEPVRIVDLARHMIRLSGFEPDEDVEIVFTGLRPGEKLHEELVADEEEVARTSHARVKVLRTMKTAAFPEIWLPRLQRCVERADVASTLRLLKILVPTFRATAPAAATVEEESAVAG
jgi:FlaA1/EpsC-like NDP-sugar epimerase